jgi:hypothetical protein
MMSPACRIRWMKLGYHLCFLILLAACLWAGATHGQVQPQTSLTAEVTLLGAQKTTMAGDLPDLPKKNVLLLHAYTYETAAYIMMDPVLLKGFENVGLGAFNLQFEFMNLAKHPDPEHLKEFIIFFRVLACPVKAFFYV